MEIDINSRRDVVGRRDIALRLARSTRTHKTAEHFLVHTVSQFRGWNAFLNKASDKRNMGLI